MIQLYNYRWFIGIDPGTGTGYSEWDAKDKKFTAVNSGTLIEAYLWIANHIDVEKTLIRIEDARKRKRFDSGRGKMTEKRWKKIQAKSQGAGSVKRDCSIWEEICEYHGWQYEMVHPIKGGTKWTHKFFCQVTGWTERIDQDARDSAVLVYQYK